MTVGSMLRRVTVAVMAMLAVSACTGGDEPQPAMESSARSDAEQSSAIETDLEVAVVDEGSNGLRSPLLGDRLLDGESAQLSDEFIEEVYATAVAGDALILFGGDSYANHLAVLDIETGALAWQLHGRDDLPGEDRVAWGPNTSGDFDGPAVVRGDAGWLVLLAYTSLYVEGAEAPHEEGVAALSVADGSVQWTAKTVDAQPDDEYSSGLYRIGAAGDTVIAAVGHSRRGDAGDAYRDGDPDYFAGYRTVALNADDGSLRWETSGISPLAVAGDVVYAAEPEPAANDEPTLVTALDATTGAELWTSAMHGPDTTVALAADGVAVLHVHTDAQPGSPIDRSMLVASQTGELLATITAEAACTHDGITRIVCGFPGADTDAAGTQLFTYDSTARRIEVAADQLPGEYAGPIAMLSGWIVMDTDTGSEVVDATGKVLTDASLHGVPVAIIDRYVVVAPTADRYSIYDFTVYALE